MDKNLLNRAKKLMEQMSVTQDNYECEKCRDLGYVFVMEDKYEVAKPCDCFAKKQAFEKLSKCSLSDAFKKKNFKNYDCNYQWQVKAKHQVLKFCSDFSNSNSSLILIGKPGTGKTHLGIAAMLKLLDGNITCKYVEYNNMIVSIKQSIIDEKNHMREMEKYLNSRVIFIDDFLNGKTTEEDINYIYRIINTRYLQQKPMIISTEKSLDEIIDFDEVVGSRIVEMAGENVIYFDENSENHRLRNFTKNY
ncbi:ATP-binding protein [Terrisporobacter sp.]